ncbi:MAG: hypothetical protein M3O61_12985 [Gemmatimonadota bacterium]|nr:hypothetical protein [Gemmatimonadota bacterium]
MRRKARTGFVCLPVVACAALLPLNAAFKRAEQTAGLIIANHILSAVDAYVSVRMRFSSDGRNGTRLGFTTLVPGAH